MLRSSVSRSVIIDYLQKSFLDTEAIGVAFVYFNYKERQSVNEVLLGSLLQQIVRRQTTVSTELRDLFNHHKIGKFRPSLRELSTLFKRESRSFLRIFVVIDALDECLDTDCTRHKLLSELQHLQPKLRLLITSRPHINLQDDFRLDIRAHDTDIERYLVRRIEMMNKLQLNVQRNPGLREAIVQGILLKASGM